MNTYEATKTICSIMIETIVFDFEHKQITTWPSDIIYNATQYFFDNNLIYTADIVSLWEDMGRPEPTEMSDGIISSITGAVWEYLHTDDTMRSQIWEALEEWADNTLDNLQIEVETDEALDDKLGYISEHES